MDVDKLVEKVSSGELTGFQLKKLMDDGQISKSERRKITKMVAKQKTNPTSKKTNTKKAASAPSDSNSDKIEKNINADESHTKNEKNSLICLRCRETGHLMKNCPLNKKTDGKKVICFNCGSTDHTLKDCKSPRGSSLPFASCFICNGTGHIARDCPHNNNGLYPNGGCCHVCGKNDHLVKDCPKAEKKRKRFVDNKRDETFSTPSTNEMVSGDSLEDNLGVSMKVLGVSVKAMKPLKKQKL